MEEELILYKFRNFENRDRIREIFVEQKVWFAPYTSFNDPFEFRFNCSFDATNEEKIRYFTEILSRHHANEPKDRIAKEARSIVLDKNKLCTFEDRMKNIKHPNEKYMELGIFSLSQNKENILLWSHYTNSHRGLCIEFKAIESNYAQREFLGKALEVKYPEDNKIPTFNVYKDDRHDISNLLIKANYWEYEGEYRIIDIDGPGHRDLPEGIISAVYLGCNISEEDRKFALELISAYTVPIEIYQAKKKNEYYELEFIKIE